MIKIRDLEPGETVARELALFKISCQDGDTRAQVMQFADIFRGKTVDVSKRSVTVEVTGTDDKIAAFEELVRPFGLIEMVRTGEIAVSRGRGATSDLRRQRWSHLPVTSCRNTTTASRPRARDRHPVEPCRSRQRAPRARSS